VTIGPGKGGQPTGKLAEAQAGTLTYAYKAVPVFDAITGAITGYEQQLVKSADGTFNVGGATDKIDIQGSKMTKAGLGISALSITTAASARAAITALDSAIVAKDTARAKFGYYINRLESTGQVLGIQAENLSQAESRISDVDVATEMATLTRNQVLAQAGTAMLAQANSIPQMALSLLR
ncbi:MAG TPA: flagellin, partial [Sedimentisphaerales bacterium]|nr:flagellin [Sedimentisphaerales bacterium]